jgi:hypothetical protein
MTRTHRRAEGARFNCSGQEILFPEEAGAAPRPPLAHFETAALAIELRDGRYHLGEFAYDTLADALARARAR